MESYIMIDGQKIPLSHETVKGIKNHLKQEQKTTTKFPTKESHSGYINNISAFSIFNYAKFDGNMNDRSTIYLYSSGGTWYDEDGKVIAGWLRFEPNEK